jgi:hypothetical protein
LMHITQPGYLQFRQNEINTVLHEPVLVGA